MHFVGQTASGADAEHQTRGFGDRNVPTMARLALETLPEDTLALLLHGMDTIQLCPLSCVCTRFQLLIAREQSVWEICHSRRWRLPPVAPSGPLPSWSADYKRRHLQDVSVVPLLEQLTEPSTRNAAWRRLLLMGEEVYERMIEIVDAASTGDRISLEAWKALRAINQSAAHRSWVHLKQAAARDGARQRQQPSVGQPTEGPFVEDGALLLLRFYLSGDELRSPDAPGRRVLEELSAISARLAARLETGHDAVEVGG